MKRSLHKRHRPASDFLTQPRGFTTRQLIGAVVVLAMALVLLPAGAEAASALIRTVITDPNGTNNAHVDGDGNLRVTGNVGITGLRRSGSILRRTPSETPRPRRSR
jgi:hypothetical protein